MDIQTIMKLVGVIAAIVFSAIKSRDVILNKGSRWRSEYEFAKSFLAEDANESLHPFVREKGYQAVAGATNVTATEVAYILSLKNPDHCLKMFVLGKRYLEVSDASGYTGLRFPKKYQSHYSRLLRKAINFMLYVSFGLLALSPFIISKQLDLDVSEIWKSLMFTFPFGALYAWFFLDSYTRLSSAEKLVEKQQQHTKLIELEG